MRTTDTIRAGLIAVFALAMAACTTTGETKPAAAPAGGEPAPAAAAEAKPAAAGVGAAAAESKPLAATQAGGAAGGPAAPAVAGRPAKEQRSVYYGFDLYNVTDQYKPVIEANAKYLNAHPDMKLTVQGNADERGAREYNLALGQRRADSVRRAMLLLGAREAQIDATSFGEEKPRAQGHSEQAWALNRRSDLVYQDEQ